MSGPPSTHVDLTGTVGVCQDTSCGRPGFVYWTSLHGPFWQTTPALSATSGDLTVPSSFHGSFLREFVQPNGIFGWRLYSDSASPQPQPGGTFEGTGYDEFKTTPPTISNCAAPYAFLADVDGTHSTGSTAIGLPNAYIETLSGFIGDIAQTNGVRVDSIKISSTASTFLSQTHGTPASPLTVGPMQFESFPGKCTNWTPTYLARNVYVTNDALLVASPAALKARCFITGLTGAWSSTRSSGAAQPSAEIYRNSSGDYRMRVFPTDAGLPVDRVGAYASCVQL